MAERKCEMLTADKTREQRKKCMKIGASFEKYRKRLKMGKDERQRNVTVRKGN